MQLATNNWVLGRVETGGTYRRAGDDREPSERWRGEGDEGCELPELGAAPRREAEDAGPEAHWLLRRRRRAVPRERVEERLRGGEHQRLPPMPPLHHGCLAAAACWPAAAAPGAGRGRWKEKRPLFFSIKTT